MLQLRYNTDLIVGETIALPLQGSVDMLVQWGDGNVSATTSTGNLPHTYASTGVYDVSATGTVTQYGRGYSGAPADYPTSGIAALTDVLYWDDALGVTSLFSSFEFATNLSAVPNNLPSTVTVLQNTFQDASALNDPNISDWGVGNVTDMRRMFWGATSFDQPLNGWDTSNVLSMFRMFIGATSFNQPLNNWETSATSIFTQMFNGATSFDQDLGDWNVSAVTDASSMFLNVTLSTPNYESLLTGWESQTLTSGVTFDGGNSTYSSQSATDSRASLIADDGWTITDGGFYYPHIYSFRADTNSICSGSEFTLTIDTSGATSAFIDNGIGWVDTSAIGDDVRVLGSVTTSAESTLVYSISAYNDIDGSVSATTSIVTVFYSTPLADACDDYSVTATDSSGIDVFFSASASSDPQEQDLTYSWLSGATELSTSESFIQTLDSANAINTLTLDVTNGCGNSATDGISVTVVSMVPPVASATVESEFVTVPSTVIISGSDSYAVNDATLVDYLWELRGSPVSTSAINAEVTITDSGTYIYTLTVYDSSGLSDTDTVTIIAGGLYSPSADAGVDQSYCVSGSESLDITLDGSDSANPTLGGYEIVWFEWDLSEFGYLDSSGSVENPYDISASVSASEGNYTTTLTVSADNGLTNTNTVNIDLNHRPTATIIIG